MRTKNEISRQIGDLSMESPRSGIIPDLADAIMIEVLIDIRDILQTYIKTAETLQDRMFPKT